MVRIIASLLAITLATSSAFAFRVPNGYQRKLDVNNQVRSHRLQQNEQQVRHPLRIGFAGAPHNQAHLLGRDTLDDLEVREPISFRELKQGRMLPPMGRERAQTNNVRGFEDVNNILQRSILDDLEVREPISGKSIGGMASRGVKRVKDFVHKHKEGLERAANIASMAAMFIPPRDLDAEQLFEREYDLD